MLAGGLLMQGMVVLDRDPPTWPFIAGLLAVVGGGEAFARTWRLRRERDVIRERIRHIVLEHRWKESEWPMVAVAFSEALERVGRGPETGEDPAAHLDRIYGRGRWIAPGAERALRQAIERYVDVQSRDELGTLWLPWFVERDHPDRPVGSLDRAGVRQVRVREAIEDASIRQALSRPDPNDPSQNHIQRIDDYTRGGWATADEPGISPPVVAYRTAEGPVLTNGCHRACAIYQLNPPRLRVRLDLRDPPPGHPDTATGPRE
jgi:hypothetical protein